MRALPLPLALFFAVPAAAQESEDNLVYVPAVQVISEDAAFEQAVLVSYGAVFERAVLYRNAIGVMPVHTDGLTIIPIEYELEDDSFAIVLEFGGAELTYGLVKIEDSLVPDDEWGMWGPLDGGPGRVAGLSFSFRFRHNIV